MWKKIVINVCYDESSIESEDELDSALQREAERAVGDGLLSPSGAEVVTTYYTEVYNIVD